jgi:phosphatidate cytidylyltransferase
MARLISALVLIAIVLAAVIYSPPVLFLIEIGIAGTFCLYEYFYLTRSMGIRARLWFGCLIFWILLVSFRYTTLPAAIIVALMLLAAFTTAMWRRHLSIRDRVFGLMAELLGAFYLAFFLYPALPLRFDFGEKLGLHWIFVLFAVIWTGDTFALIAGKRLGRTPFAPFLSPKKTYEGAAGGLVAGVLAAIVMQHFFYKDLPLEHVIFVSVLLGIFGQLGDLAESLLKRAAEVKDSSHIIPGHGGVLDRLDSMLFAIPVLYFYLLLLYKTRPIP